MKRLLAIFALAFSIPFIIWGVVTLNFNFNKGAEQIERASIAIGNSPTLGPVNAPITIIEFSDFECPFCKSFHNDTFQQLLNEYPNKIKFVYKQFPIASLHPNSIIASEASLCARDQDKFWQMHGLLFENQSNLSSETVKLLASTIGLDTTVFNVCLDAHLSSLEITDDINIGTLNNVVGTPTFFINGIKLDGAQPLTAFKQIIDNELNVASPSPTPIVSPTPSSTPLSKDDVYFVKNNTDITLQTVGEYPNVSISPNEIESGKTYIFNVKTTLQNTNKTDGVYAIYIPIQLIINNIAIGENSIYIPLISGHRDGASYTVSGVYTSTQNSVNIRVAFDPENKYSETNENNNQISFDYAGRGEPNSCNGTCGSNYNCKGEYFCYQGFCRNPNCPSSNTCGCATSTPIPTTKSKSYITPSPEEIVTYIPDTPQPTSKYISVSPITYKPTLAPIPRVNENIKVQDDEKFDYLPIVIPLVATLIAIYAFIVLIKSFKK